MCSSCNSFVNFFYLKAVFAYMYIDHILHKAFSLSLKFEYIVEQYLVMFV